MKETQRKQGGRGRGEKGGRERKWRERRRERKEEEGGSVRILKTNRKCEDLL